MFRLTVLWVSSLASFGALHLSKACPLHIRFCLLVVSCSFVLPFAPFLLLLEMLPRKIVALGLVRLSLCD